MTPSSISLSNLESYQGKNRLLLIFAVSESHPDYCMQLQMLSIERANLTLRDIVVIKILSNGKSTIEGQDVDDHSTQQIHEHHQSIDDNSAQQIRDRFGVSQHEFCVILVGKDGTEKRRERKPVQPSLLFSQIDDMSMRQREMQEQHEVTSLHNSRLNTI
jgi:DNA-binding transcriptional regulator YiaG